MIVRNNARTIEGCITSVRPWVGEMIVVDTGSTDETPEICRRLGAKVFHFPWCDSFAAARNESLKYASGQWIFWMDSDDVIDSENGRKLRAFVERLVRQPDPLASADPPTLGYVMQVHCPGPGDDGVFDVTVVDHCKLIRNHPAIRFEHRLHEQIMPSIRRAGGQIAFTDIFVVHAGADRTPQGRRGKITRDLRLLRLDIRERPNHPFVLYNLGMTFFDHHRFEKALRYMRRAICVLDPADSITRKAFAYLISAHSKLGRIDQARAACRQARAIFPDDVEILFKHANIAWTDGRLEEAAQSFLDVLNHPPTIRRTASVDRGLFGFKARHNLAGVYTAMGRLDLAETQWRTILHELPGYPDAWQLLAECLIQQGRLADVQSLVDYLLRHTGMLESPSGPDSYFRPPSSALRPPVALRPPFALPEPPRTEALASVGVLTAVRLAEITGQQAAAITLLESAVERLPGDVRLWQALAQHLFAVSPEHSEAALRRVLELDPAEAGVWHNLGTLHNLQKRWSDAIDCFRRSLRHRPNSAITQLCLGYPLRNTGREAEARKAWEECVRLEPGSNLASEARRRLTEPEAHPTETRILPLPWGSSPGPTPFSPDFLTADR